MPEIAMKKYGIDYDELMYLTFHPGGWDTFI